MDDSDACTKLIKCEDLRHPLTGEPIVKQRADPEKHAVQFEMLCKDAGVDKVQDLDLLGRAMYCISSMDKWDSADKKTTKAELGKNQNDLLQILEELTYEWQNANEVRAGVEGNNTLPKEQHDAAVRALCENHMAIWFGKPENHHKSKEKNKDEVEMEEKQAEIKARLFLSKKDKKAAEAAAKVVAERNLAAQTLKLELEKLQQEQARLKEEEEKAAQKNADEKENAQLAEKRAEVENRLVRTRAQVKAAAELEVALRALDKSAVSGEQQEVVAPKSKAKTKPKSKLKSKTKSKSNKDEMETDEVVPPETVPEVVECEDGEDEEEQKEPEEEPEKESEKEPENEPKEESEEPAQKKTRKRKTDDDKKEEAAQVRKSYEDGAMTKSQKRAHEKQLELAEIKFGLKSVDHTVVDGAKDEIEELNKQIEELNSQIKKLNCQKDKQEIMLVLLFEKIKEKEGEAAAMAFEKQVRKAARKEVASKYAKEE
jgi:hypothetical protein